MTGYLDHGTTPLSLLTAASLADLGYGLYPAAGSSLNETLCYDRRRWTGVETACVPLGGTTMGSPHLIANKDCNARVAEPFGIPQVSYWQNRPPASGCGIGFELAGVLAVLGRAARRRDGSRRPS